MLNSIDIPNIVADAFACTPRTGWIKLELKDRAMPPGFSTNRIGKLTSQGYIAFTIGSNEAGRALGLDEQIRSIIREAGVEPEDQPSTDGQGKIYPAFNLSQVDEATASRIFAAVIEAVYKVSS